MFFSPFSIANTSLGEERANLSAFHTFVRFVLVWICRFPLPLSVWDLLPFFNVTHQVSLNIRAETIPWGIKFFFFFFFFFSFNR